MADHRRSGRGGRTFNISTGGSRPSSRIPTGMASSGLYFDAFRGSRSFIGSKTALHNMSKRNLHSESGKNLKAPPQAQLLDEAGFDVTPLSLLPEELAVNKKTQVSILRADTATPSASMFQSSVYGSHTTAMGASGAGSLTQPFSQSVFGGSTTGDLGASTLSVSMTDEFRAGMITKLEIAEMQESEESDIVKALSFEDLEKEVEIVLSETETIYMLDIPGTCVALDSEEAQVVKKNNEKYEALLKIHSGNDNYVDRSMQTINDAFKFKQVQTDSVHKQEAGMCVSNWDMYTTYEAISTEGTSETTNFDEIQSSRAISRMTTDGSTGTSRAPTVMGTVTGTGTDSSRIPGESSMDISMIDSSVGSSNNPNVVHRKKSDHFDPTIPNDHPILKLESLMDSFRTIERAITQNIYHVKQAMYRNEDPIEDPDFPSPAVAVTLANPHLEKLWTYSCPLTKKRKVTCMAWNHSNKDIIAVGYGTFKADEDGMGLICCWSIKNPEFPERIFHAPSGITSLSFSHINPNLLAAGLFNGSIVLYNARSSEHECVLDSGDALHKHSAPVWQINWVMKEHSLGESKSENLISISVDGHILQWSIRKGFESSQLMNLKRMSTTKQQSFNKKKSKGMSVVPGMHLGKHDVSAKNNQGAGGGEAYISQHAPGMGFDFWPKDPNIYLACTDEGYIHKCSCSYNEQVLETYVGHTGPVYRVTWSPFVSNYFLSCSADWSVKLWVQNKTAPIQSFSAAQKSVNDVCWSPFSSTVFGCVSEGRVEIWNLDYSSLDPIIVHRPLSPANLTTITFAHNSKVVLVGDTSGDVSVFLLNNLQTFPPSQEEALLTAISSMSKRESIPS